MTPCLTAAIREGPRGNVLARRTTAIERGRTVRFLLWNWVATAVRAAVPEFGTTIRVQQLRRTRLDYGLAG